MYKKLISQNKN